MSRLSVENNNENRDREIADHPDFPLEQTKKIGTSPERGYLVVISAPSGGGKTTVIRRLLEIREADFVYSISATTRAPRAGEQHGRDYYFLAPEAFATQAHNNGFIEWAAVHGKLYGTPRVAVENWMAAGKLVFMDIDVQGGINVKNQYGARAMLIFIKPPSMESLRDRLLGRNSDSPEAIKTRLQNATEELRKAQLYDHVVVNHKLDDTVAEVRAIINQYRV